MKMKNLIMEFLRGILIGTANIIPGVSGGTMMVSMGIYDTLIFAVTHLFSQFKKSVRTLLPYLVGMVVALLALSYVINNCLTNFPLPTNALFIGLILGGLPAIWQEMKSEKKGITGGVLFLLFFALVIVLKLIAAENVVAISLSFWEVIKLFFLGCLASATMVIPGVSGSMILMLLGYYQPVIAAVKGLMSASFMTNIGILLPFGVGVVVGIFAVSKLIEVLLSRWKGYTYCGILGLVLASPVVILMNAFSAGAVITVWTVLISVVLLAVGFAVAYFMSDKKSSARPKDAVKSAQ